MDKRQLLGNHGMEQAQILICAIFVVKFQNITSTFWREKSHLHILKALTKFGGKCNSMDCDRHACGRKLMSQVTKSKADFSFLVISAAFQRDKNGYANPLP